MTAWRFRRCPACKTVAPGGEFVVTRYGVHWRRWGGATRVCPSCGHRAPTRDFVVVPASKALRVEKVELVKEPWWAR